MIYERRVCIVQHVHEQPFKDRVHSWLPVAEKYGAKVVCGVFQAEIGGREAEIYYILAFEDLAHRERVYKSVRQDPDFLKLRAKWDEEGHWMNDFTNEILNSTEYASGGKPKKVVEI